MSLAGLINVTQGIEPFLPSRIPGFGHKRSTWHGLIASLARQSRTSGNLAGRAGNGEMLPSGSRIGVFWAPSYLTSHSGCLRTERGEMLQIQYFDLDLSIRPSSLFYRYVRLSSRLNSKSLGSISPKFTLQTKNPAFFYSAVRELREHSSHRRRWDRPR